MKIEIDNYTSKGLKELNIVKEFKKDKANNKYSVYFEDYELIFFVDKPESFKYRFTFEDKDFAVDSSNFQVSLKKNGLLCWQGECTYSEPYVTTSENETLSLNVSCESGEYRVIFYSEYGESFLDFYNKIFS